jgi:hypothetical protein
MTARFSRYPGARSGNKGNEPENTEVDIFDDGRSSLVFVYDAADPKNPAFKQTLPAGCQVCK